MQPIETNLLQDTRLWLGSIEIEIGCCIAWLETQHPNLIASEFSMLRALGHGVLAWLRGDKETAQKAWSEAWELGLQEPLMVSLLSLVGRKPPKAAVAKKAFNEPETLTTPLNSSHTRTQRLHVYVDGSFDPHTSSGGVSCAYSLHEKIVVLSESLPPPVSCNTYAEIKAIHLALSTPVLEPYPLLILTDSQTAYMAVLPDLPSPKLQPAIYDLAGKTTQLLLQRGAKLQWIKSRNGNALHDQADLFAGRISRFAQIAV